MTHADFCGTLKYLEINGKDSHTHTCHQDWPRLKCYLKGSEDEGAYYVLTAKKMSLVLRPCKMELVANVYQNKRMKSLVVLSE